MDLKKYKFTDDHGHPLENCVDYISMQKEIESLREELDEEIMLRITLQKMNQKLVDDKKAWKSLNKYTEEE